MSKEVDIYGDLDNFNKEQKFKEKWNEILELQAKYKRSIETINDLQNENKAYQKKIKNIERSFWSLLETAKMEVKRKEKQINELDNITFRRHNPKPKNKTFEKIWSQKDDVVNISFKNDFLSNDGKSCNESLGNYADNFSDSNIRTKPLGTSGEFTTEGKKIAKLSNISKSINTSVKNSKNFLMKNETKSRSDKKKLSEIIKEEKLNNFVSEKETEMSEESIQLKILQDVIKIKEKNKNKENKDEVVKSALQPTDINSEYARNIEDLIFDEMLDESNSLNVKNKSIEPENTESTLVLTDNENEKICKYVQANTANLESTSFNVENRGNKVNNKNIEKSSIANIKDEIKKTFDKMEEELLHEKNKTNLTINVPESAESLNREEKQEELNLHKTKIYCSVKYNNLRNGFENNEAFMKTNADFELEHKTNLIEAEQLDIESCSLKKNGIMLSDIQLKSKAYENPAYLEISNTDKMKVIHEDNSTNIKENIFEHCDEKRNIKRPQEVLVKENFKNNESGAITKNKNDKFVGHKIDGFKPKNTEKQGKDAFKLKQTLFQEIISGNTEKCERKGDSVEKYKSGKELEVKIEKVNKITTGNVDENYCSKKDKSIDLILEPLNNLTMFHNTLSEQNTLNQCGKIFLAETKNQNKKINKNVPDDNHENSQTFETLNQYNDGKTCSKINILQNIQIAPPQGDETINSTAAETKNEPRTKKFTQNTLTDKKFGVIDIKPKILKPDVNKVLPFLNNSVQINKIATDELIKILDDAPKVSQIATASKCSSNLDEKFAKLKDDTKLLEGRQDELKLSSSKPDIFQADKNSDSPNQSETLEAIKFLTDNLLEISNECSPLKEQKHLSLELPKGDNFENVINTPKFEKYIKENLNKPTEKENVKKMPKEICVQNMFELEKKNKSEKLEFKTQKKIKAKFVKERDTSKKTLRKTNNKISILNKKNEKATKRSICEIRLRGKNKENVLNNTENDYGKGSVNLRNTTTGEPISEQCEKSESVTSTSKCNPTSVDIISLKCETKADILQEEIDNIFGKSPFNSNRYIENLGEIKCNVMTEICDINEEYGLTNDSPNKLCMLNKKYEMEMDSDGVPVWNITKKRKRKRKSAQIGVNDFVENNKRGLEAYENSSLDISDNVELFNGNLFASDKVISCSEPNSKYCNEIQINNYHKSISSCKIPKINKISNYEVVNHSNQSGKITNEEKDESCIEKHIYNSFKSPHKVDQSFNYENNIEQEFLRIFGKSPPNEKYIEISKAENNCEKICNYKSENMNNSKINLKNNQIYDKEIFNEDASNFSTNHGSGESQKYFVTSTKTYEMQHDISDGIVNWVIKRKNRKFKVN
ncbi:repetitive organellar protein isoform X2 [Condylostylus longicornis]|uniref:repetitive organellar protein isoform X2 n=1 Tax=Condylostylus longicornis TaxID=2530218 RepID=UPI00244E0A39|nr:repetitive organellar protein isoform X2 [Condylostylus longicornis]